MHISESYDELFPQLRKINQLYQEVDEVIDMIKAWFSVDCPPGCGACCDTHPEKIEASITEMLPLCIHLYENSAYQELLDQADRERCLFYSTSLPQGRAGCCSVYEYRPLVCRLFGFTFMRDKYGGMMPVACSILKGQFSKKAPAHAVPVRVYPELRSFSLHAMMLDPFGGKRYPINQAFARAMEYVVLKADLLRKTSHPRHEEKDGCGELENSMFASLQHHEYARDCVE